MLIRLDGPDQLGIGPVLGHRHQEARQHETGQPASIGTRTTSDMITKRTNHNGLPMTLRKPTCSTSRGSHSWDTTVTPHRPRDRRDPPSCVP